MITGENPYINQLEDEILDDCLRVEASQISQHINILVTNKQCDFSQWSNLS
jgi:hypothetical protein